MSSKGIVKLNVLPCPIPSECTATTPPVSSTIYLTIVRPRPRPSLFIFAVLYSLPKRVNRSEMSSSAMPAPVSLTDTKRVLSTGPM